MLFVVLRALPVIRAILAKAVQAEFGAHAGVLCCRALLRGIQLPQEREPA